MQSSEMFYGTGSGTLLLCIQNVGLSHNKQVYLLRITLGQAVALTVHRPNVFYM